MDFYVYDNIMTYNKLNPYNGIESTRVEIIGIEIPESGAFWFHTEMHKIETNVNLYKPYVHFHPGIGSTNVLRSNDKIHQVKKNELKYNPKEKCIEIKPSALPWKKAIYKKRVRFYGSEVPKKTVSAIGLWFYNLSTNSIHFILDYYTQKLKFHWEMEEIEEPPTFQQLMKVEELEKKIKEKEELLASSSK